MRIPISLMLTAVAAARLLSSPAAVPQQPVAPADLVLRGGKIVTLDDARPEAQAMAARGDTIVALGSEQEIRRYIGANTKVIDLQGAFGTPGFIDGHVHFTGVGEAARNLQLSAADHRAGVGRRVAAEAQTGRPGGG